MNVTRPRILCVDDEPANLKLLESVLVLRGYEVLAAGSGKDALEIIGKHRVDLVLLDVMMPEVNGYDVCRRIKEDERWRSIPVVMVTALTSKEERVKSIEAGAEDFISKPFDHTELLTRVKMLLRMKDLNDSLNSAYVKITDLAGFGERLVISFDPVNFNFISSFDNIVNHLVRRTADMADKPQQVVVGFLDEKKAWQWYLYESLLTSVDRTWVKLDIQNSLDFSKTSSAEGGRVSFYTEATIGGGAIKPFVRKMAHLSITVSNMASFVGRDFCIFALNYSKGVSRYDAEILNSIAMQSLFLKSLSRQVKETEQAFDYLAGTMARAAEANDEDTGNHILRVGEYCALLAEHLGMAEKQIEIIRIQAPLHDVGKIHIRPEILKKPGRLTPEEFEEVKTHTTAGAAILGDHVRLALAKEICLSHHERWNGGGYPRGLKGEQIPFSGRILNIADQYDALRNPRVYKPAFDHETAYRTITEGDGRTLPDHFDPQVLRAFRETAARFAEIYEKMRG